MGKNDAEDVVNVGENEVHCTFCGTLLGSFAGGSVGKIRCKNCRRDLRFSVRDRDVVVNGKIQKSN